MARGAGAGLSVLLGCEALLLVAAVATVLPAVRDGIEGAEGRIVERIASLRESVEPMIAAAIARATGGVRVQDVPGMVLETAEVEPELPSAPVQAPREPPPAPAFVEAPREAPVTTASVPRQPPGPVIALAPVEANPPPMREFAPPPQGAPLIAPVVTPAPPAPVVAPPAPPTLERAAPSEPATRERPAPSTAQPPPPPQRRTLAEMLDRPAPGEIAALQRRLIELGLLRGEADDVVGELTIEALLRYLDRHRFGPSTQVETLTAHMDRMTSGGRAPSMPTEVFLIGREFSPELRAELTRTDLQTARGAITHALSALERGESYAALSRRNGASFVVTPIAGERYDRCRRFTLTIHAAGREQTGRGIRACRIGPNWHLSDG